MASPYADENFPLGVVEALRRLGHGGIVVCTQDTNVERQAAAIHEAVQGAASLQGALLRINRPA